MGDPPVRKKFCSILLILFLIIQVTFVLALANPNTEVKHDLGQFPDDNTLQGTRNLLENAPKVFTENKGQVKDPEIRFYDTGGSIWFTDSGVWFNIWEQEIKSEINPMDLLDPFKMYKPKELTRRRGVIIKQEFLGANQVIPHGINRVLWNSNFFYGNDSSKWRANVPNYQEIYYENIYDGIDLRYYLSNTGLKYDFIIHPWGNSQDIRLRYTGVKNLVTDYYGNLILKTGYKDIIDGNIFIYQEENYKINPVEGRFVLYGDNEFGFEIIGEYSKDMDLIIDPNLNLEYSTYTGGTNEDTIHDLDIDSKGNVYATGQTKSGNFPKTPGVFDEVLNGTSDVFVFKIDENGSALLFSTFIGGDDFEEGFNIAIDLAGNSYITGYTYSPDFPTTPGAFDSELIGEDVFVLKLNENGSDLIYSTLIGGDSGERGFDIIINDNGEAIIEGYTYSKTTFPITPDAFDSSHNGGDDLFILKLSQNGSTVLYSTFIGGSGSDLAGSMDIDSQGNIVVCGSTTSSDFPNTTGTYDSTLGGFIDGIVFKFNMSSNKLLFATYIGGSLNDLAASIAIDQEDNILISGGTGSSDFPITKNAFDSTLERIVDGFIAKINPTGTKLLYSTYFGGNNFEDIGNIKVDSFGNIIVTGRSNSTNLSVTNDAYQHTNRGGWDGFILKLNKTGSKCLYLSYFGGTNTDHNYFNKIDAKNNLYFTGYSYSNNFPTTSGVYSQSAFGDRDGFLAKFSSNDRVDIESIELLENNEPVSTVYAKLQPYTFRIKVEDSFGIDDINLVRVILKANNSIIKLNWNRISNKFTEILDPNNYVTLEQTSLAVNDSDKNWTIDFDITFNWTYPGDCYTDIEVKMYTFSTYPVINKTSHFFEVNNKLNFIGELTLEGEDSRIIPEFGLVRGGETLKWSGLTTVYDGTTDVYPNSSEFEVELTDSNDDSWSVAPNPGQEIIINSNTPKETNQSGFNYSIKLVDIPQECDLTNESYTIFIDYDNVTFSDPSPKSSKWHTTDEIVAGITITDLGGGVVDGSSIQFATSVDNGENWINWKNAKVVSNAKEIMIEETVALPDGDSNLIKWRARDSLGNGPRESDQYKIMVDTTDVEFLDHSPIQDQISRSENITFNITLFDGTSGVNASTIQYATSIDNGTTWSKWSYIEGFENADEIYVTINLTFPNGTENKIKLRAVDIAGNGPEESDEYIIKINTWVPPEPPPQKPKPECFLLKPTNGFIINKTSVELSWELLNKSMLETTYELYFDKIISPGKLYDNLTNTSIIIDDLDNNTVYYWTIIPIFNGTSGRCISGTWRFTVKLDPEKSNGKPDKNETLYKLDITGPEFIILKPGQEKVIQVSVVNLGEERDTIKLKVQVTNELANITIDEPTTFELERNKIRQSIITIKLSDNIEPGSFEINVLALSLKSGGNVTDEHIIMVEVKNEDNQGNELFETIQNWLWFILIMILIIILTIVTLYLVSKKRQRTMEEYLIPEKGEGVSKTIIAQPEEESTIKSESTLPVTAEPAQELVGTTSTSVAPALPTTAPRPGTTPAQVQQAGGDAKLAMGTTEKVPLLPPKNDIQNTDTNTSPTEDEQSAEPKVDDKEQNITENITNQQ